jgi:hypothetical protein
MSKYIVCTGNVLDGHKFHGTFDNYDDAFHWSIQNFEVSGFYITELNAVEIDDAYRAIDKMWEMKRLEQGEIV